MNTKLTLFASLFLIMGLLVSCTGNGTQGDKGESGAGAEFILQGSLPDITPEITSYKIIQPDVSAASVSTLGARLGFAGGAGPVDPYYIAMSNPEKEEILQVDINSGAIEYTCLSEMFSPSPNLPDDNEAAKIAIEFLQLIGLWYPDLVADEAIVGGTSGGVPSHLLVRFTRYIDGCPVTGPGSKFAVRIGDRGKVVQLLMRYNELEPDKEVQIIEPAAAFEKLKAGDAVFTLPIDCSTVVITDVSLGYYLKSISEKQEYLMPYYIFRGEGQDGKEAPLEEFIGWVDAISR